MTPLRYTIMGWALIFSGLILGGVAYFEFYSRDAIAQEPVEAADDQDYDETDHYTYQELQEYTEAVTEREGEINVMLRIISRSIKTPDPEVIGYLQDMIRKAGYHLAGGLTALEMLNTTLHKAHMDAFDDEMMKLEALVNMLSEDQTQEEFKKQSF